MKNELVTVIVPIHNSEKTLRRCIESIMKQTYKELEIILVDNNSTDNSYCICNEYIMQDNRIIVLEEKKEGVSAARNRGLKEGKGIYVTFVDSDDWIIEDEIEKVVEKIGDSDIAIFGYEVCKNIKDKEYIVYSYNAKANAINSVYSYWMNQTYGTWIGNFDYVWNKIFKYEVIRKNNIYFDIMKKVYEDIDFVFQFLRYANTVCLVKGKYYMKVENDILERLSFNADRIKIIEAKFNMSNMYLESISSTKEKEELRNKIYNLIAGQLILALIREFSKEHISVKKIKYVNGIVSNEMTKQLMKYYVVEDGNSHIIPILVKRKKSFLLCLFLRWKALWVYCIKRRRKMR